jgi:hypothetical protein
VVEQRAAESAVPGIMVFAFEETEKEAKAASPNRAISPPWSPTIRELFYGHIKKRSLASMGRSLGKNEFRARAAHLT